MRICAVASRSIYDPESALGIPISKKEVIYWNEMECQAFFCSTLSILRANSRAICPARKSIQANSRPLFPYETKDSIIKKMGIIAPSFLNESIIYPTEKSTIFYGRNIQYAYAAPTGVFDILPNPPTYSALWTASTIWQHVEKVAKSSLIQFRKSLNEYIQPLYYSLSEETPEDKEQRKGVLSILELTLLDDTNSQVCPVRHLSTYLRASKGRRKPHSGDSVFIQNEGKPLDVKEINIIVLSTLSSSGIDIKDGSL
ncbi:hypothetical protein ACTFIR_003958 [Dictyostelium discoideum]